MFIYGCTYIYIHRCVSDIVLWLLFSKNWKIQKAKDHIIYLQWYALWVEAKKKKNLQNYLCRNIKNFLKSSLANGCFFNFQIFTLRINSSTGFVYFEETFHFFFFKTWGVNDAKTVFGYVNWIICIMYY